MESFACPKTWFCFRVFFQMFGKSTSTCGFLKTELLRVFLFFPKGLLEKELLRFHVHALVFFACILGLIEEHRTFLVDADVL